MTKNNYICYTVRARGAPGFSLIELMLTVAIVAVVAAVATPSLNNVVQNSRIRGQASDLMTNLAIARAEATKRSARVTLCASTTWQNASPSCTGGSWANGYIVFADQNGNGSFDAGDVVIAVAEPLAGGNSLVSNNFTSPASADKFQYRPSGSTNLPAAGGTFKLCDSRSGNFGRLIQIGVTGRTVSNFTICP